MQRFGAVGFDAEFLAGVHDGVPQAHAIVGGGGDFVAEFAGEADAVSANGICAELARLVVHVGEGFV